MKNNKLIVVSAVNLVVGGTLTILRDCLEYLSAFIENNREFTVIVLIHDKKLAYYPNIKYIEIPWAKKSWIRRLWCEYYTMKEISVKLSPVFLWLSLHDATPRVNALHQGVYCHNSFPFYKWNWMDFYFDYKIVLFSLLSKYVYRMNIKRNDYVIVQQDWLRKEFYHKFGLRESQVIVARPEKCEKKLGRPQKMENNAPYSFFFAATPNSHKNFECICKAVSVLENKLGQNKFQVFLTYNGKENRYSKWLYRRWANLSSIKLLGFLDRKVVSEYYHLCDCLLFPSKVETWGLPISEFISYDKPMLLADLPYAHETACGSSKTAFFDPFNAKDLAIKMERLIMGDESFLSYIPYHKLAAPSAETWEQLFAFFVESVDINEIK